MKFSLYPLLIAVVVLCVCLVPIIEAANWQDFFDQAKDWSAGQTGADGLIEDLENFTPGSVATPTITPVSPTETPTQEAGTPTPLPTPLSEFAISDYFPLDSSSEWYYEGMPQEGGSPEDNFTWTQQGSENLGIPPRSVVVIETTTDEPTDDRNGDKDFWSYDGEGNLLFHGMHFAQDRTFEVSEQNIVLPGQDVVLLEPVVFGTSTQQIGSNVEQTGTTTLQTNVGEIEAQFTLRVAYVEFQNGVTTPLGLFDGALYLRISGVVSAEYKPPFPPITIPVEFTIRESEIWLGRGVGMIKQDQQPDPNDAQVQGISRGTVAGIPVQADR